MPPIIIVCETKALQNRLHKRLGELADKHHHAPTLATTSREDLQAMSAGDDAIWRTVSLSRALAALDQISSK
ncbi:hypothetical protein IPG36_05380 [bacterium]|nr:MAG: hypothetical protein IPG36_05380 [bacterium]